MNNLSEFNKALETVNDERGVIYGHPLEHFTQIATMKDVVRMCPDPAIRHALEMIIVKVARLTQTPDHLDSVIDIAGYARTIAMINDRKMGDPK